ncbi:MAG: hypothetical protein K8S24_04350 [Candidatus Aegiribacteria sp.]|nr:hypothetical protein [Candidatus Aegiribacteria sp.]
MVFKAEVGFEAAAICGPVVRGSNVPAAATEDASGTRTPLAAAQAALNQKKDSDGT